MSRTRPYLMIIFGVVLIAQPARRVFREPDAAFRAKVKELAFPADVIARPGVEVAMTLHFKPSFHPEEEILLAVESGGAGQIVYRAAAVESQRVFESLGVGSPIGPNQRQDERSELEVDARHLIP